MPYMPTLTPKPPQCRPSRDVGVPNQAPWRTSSPAGDALEAQGRLPGPGVSELGSPEVASDLNVRTLQSIYLRGIYRTYIQDPSD